MNDFGSNDFGLTFHHIGLAVKKEEDALLFLGGLGYETGEKIYDPEQKVNLRLCTAPQKPAIELVMPNIIDGEAQESPLTPILKRQSEVIYHTCYETQDLDKSLEAMESKELRVLPVSPPTPAILFGGRKVSFYTIMGFGLIEILEP
ncbi:MAG: VOC family protein [Alphaproteobacteria bacterium]|nr:VOC family protein [Alphaproteobacteria bacterium]